MLNGVFISGIVKTGKNSLNQLLRAANFFSTSRIFPPNFP
jgi:hypothetical protein